MGSHWWRPLALGLTVVTASTFGPIVARADDDPKRAHDLLITIDDSDLQYEKLQTNRYIVGVTCAPADAALHAQLPDLPKDQGLLVQQVMPDHAAAKAGVQAHDILIIAGDKPLARVADLTSAIEASKGAEITLKLVRAGKTISIAVKPDEQKTQGEPVRPSHDREMLEKWIKQLTPDAGQQQLHLEVLRDFMAKHELPDDLSVNIYREGKHPAKITVKRGDQKWEANEDDLSKLPEDIRHHVEQLVGAGPMKFDVKDLAASIPLTVPLGDTLTRNPADLEQRIENRLNDMNKRLDEMRAAIEQLRNQGGGEKKSR